MTQVPSEEEYLEVLRIEKARRNPNAFVEYVRGFKQAGMHRQLQAQFDLDDSYSEIFRGGGKTQQSATRIAFDIGKDINIRAKYVQQNDIEASRTTALIKYIIESEAYRRVFPHVKPDKRNWGQRSFTVQRDRMDRDPTVLASGIFGRPGGRYDLLVGDDICDMRNSIHQPKERDRVKEYWRSVWLPMADPGGKRPPRVRKIGTPWHVEDLTADWRKVHRDRGTLLEIPVRNYESPWPEKFTNEYFRSLREGDMGELAYSRAYELKAISSDDCPIKPEWFRYWMSQDEIPDGGRRFIGVDPAFKDGEENDFSVLMEGIWAKPNFYVTADLGDARTGGMCRGKWLPPDLMKNIVRRAEAFNPSEIVVEDVAAQGTIGSVLLETHPLPIRLFNPSSDPEAKSKFTRVAWLGIYIENGKIIFRGDPATGRIHPSQQALFDELTGYPVADHRDTIDALFYASRKAIKSSRGAKMGW